MVVAARGVIRDERTPKALSRGSVEWDEHERRELRQRGEMKEEREGVRSSNTCVSEWSLCECTIEVPHLTSPYGSHPST